MQITVLIHVSVTYNEHEHMQKVRMDSTEYHHSTSDSDEETIALSKGSCLEM